MSEASVRPLRLPVIAAAAMPLRPRPVHSVLAFALLLVCAPVLALIALAVRLQGGPVLVREVRRLPDGLTIRCWQFRTVAVARSGALQAAEVTPLGDWLSRTGLSELPALIDVAVGRMVVSDDDLVLSAPADCTYSSER